MGALDRVHSWGFQNTRPAWMMSVLPVRAHGSLRRNLSNSELLAVGKLARCCARDREIAGVSRLIRLLSLPLIVTSGINLMFGMLFLALHRRLKRREEVAIQHHFVFAVLALTSAAFLGAFAVLLNSFDSLDRLDLANRITIIAAMFNILLAVHFYVLYFDYRPPLRLAWLYAINFVFVVLCAWPSRFFLAKQYFRTSKYYVGLAYGVGFRVWGGWIVLLSIYAMFLLVRAYRRTPVATGGRAKATVVLLLLATGIWLMTGICDDLTALQVLDLPPLTWVGSGFISICIAWLLVVEIDTLYDERRHLNLKLMHDHLTNAYSRGMFEVRMTEAIEGLRRGQLPGISLCVLDVDDFKGINDKFGHAVGDEVLRAVATAATSAVRATDCAARLGGDEFVVLLPGVPRDTAAESIVERICKNVASCFFDCDGAEVRVSCSFGLVHADASYAWEDDLAAKLLKAADVALYGSKHKGKNCVSVISLAPPTGPDRRTSRRLQLRTVASVD